jgi:hypothetical protein
LREDSTIEAAVQAGREASPAITGARRALIRDMLRRLAATPSTWIHISQKNSLLPIFTVTLPIQLGAIFLRLYKI